MDPEPGGYVLLSGAERFCFWKYPGRPYTEPLPTISRKVLFLGGGLLSAGILMSAFSLVSSPLPMYLTYGVMQGLGQGMMYTVILATAQQWFPDRTGFASGIVVTANGLCGLFMAPFSRQLLEKEGQKPHFLL